MRGSGGRRIFRDRDDRHTLDEITGHLLRQQGARAHAYCWMTNHLHLIVEMQPAAVHMFAAGLAAMYSAAYGEALFDLPAKPFRVDADAHLLPLIRYTHLNPVRAGLVADAAHWPWSGHRAYLGYDRPPWLSTDLGFRLLGGDLLRGAAAYRALFA